MKRGPIKRQDRAARFWAKVVPSGECWLWTGAANQSGYGQFFLEYLDGKGSKAVTIVAHRWSYEQFHGPIPDGFQVDHLCRNTRCVHPGHLEAVTQEENLRRQAAAITSCPRGHDYSPENTYVNPKGHRKCRECMRRWGRAYKSRLPLRGHRNATKTHCLRGHPFDEENTYWRPDGSRLCRACSSARQRRSVPPRDYRLEIHADGTHVLKTRPLGGARWSPPIKLEPVPVGTLGRSS